MLKWESRSLTESGSHEEHKEPEETLNEPIMKLLMQMFENHRRKPELTTQVFRRVQGLEPHVLQIYLLTSLS